MSYGILLLRVVLGATMAAHGAQKLFGWFGGGGLAGTATGFAQLRYRAPLTMVLVAGLGEFGGGVLLATGLLTPLAAFALAVVMLNAIAVVHWRNGFWSAKGGYEFNLLILAAAIAIAATGAGRFSLDALIGWADNVSGLWWAAGVAASGALVSGATLTVGRRAAAAPDVRAAAPDAPEAARRAG
jgi:putative oxidoreductase